MARVAVCMEMGLLYGSQNRELGWDQCSAVPIIGTDWAFFLTPSK